MTNISNLSDTIVPKSDQLNADDLITGPRTIVVTSVQRGNNESPIFLHYEGSDGRPYKPCKSMRRVLLFAWGQDGNQWIGKAMTIYCDPKVIYAGKEVGGIRISHLSGIEKRISVSLTVTRGKKAPYVIDVLKPVELPPYDHNKFAKALPTMKDWIESGKMTTEQVINKCEQTGKLSDNQRQTIREFDISENEPDADSVTEFTE